MESMETGTVIEYDHESDTGTIEDESGDQLTFYGIAGRLAGLKGSDREPALFLLLGDPAVPGGKPTIKPLLAKAGDEVFFERYPDDPDYARVWGFNEARRIVLSARNKFLTTRHTTTSGSSNYGRYVLPPVPALDPL